MNSLLKAIISIIVLTLSEMAIADDYTTSTFILNNYTDVYGPGTSQPLMPDPNSYDVTLFAAQGATSAPNVPGGDCLWSINMESGAGTNSSISPYPVFPGDSATVAVFQNNASTTCVVGYTNQIIINAQVGSQAGVNGAPSTPNLAQVCTITEPLTNTVSNGPSFSDMTAYSDNGNCIVNTSYDGSGNATISIDVFQLPEAPSHPTQTKTP